MGSVYNDTFISDAVAKVNIKTKVSAKIRLVTTHFLMPKAKKVSRRISFTFGKEFDQN
jgi:hypothetical protein